MNTLSNRRVLLVDDMPTIHADFRKILDNSASVEAAADLEQDEALLFNAAPRPASKVHFELGSAYQGSQALDMVRAARRIELPYAMAFVDMRMPPGWDGVETIEHLWQADPELQVVLCTAYSDYSWQEVLDRLDVRDRLLILKKPFDPIEVFQLACALTAKWEVTRQAALKMSSLEHAVQVRTKELSQANASLTYAQSLAHVGNWEYRPETADGLWSPEVFRILGLEAAADTPSFQSLMQRVPEEEQPQLLQAFLDLRTAGTSFQLEHRIVRPDGKERFVFQRAEATVSEQDGVVMLRGTLQDITERKLVEAKIDYLANHDALTGLPNRNLLADRMAQAKAQAHRAGQHVAVMLLDLDRFKFINDSYGHPIGDALLNAVAFRLKSAVREGDTVARLGGDEFVVMLTGLAMLAHAVEVAKKIVATFSEPFSLEGHELHVTTSVGISVYPDHGLTGDTLLKTADAALYGAKDKGRNCFMMYTSDMGARVEERAAIEHALHSAVAKRELELHYQPKINLNSGKIYGVEALVRWRRPGIGLIPPSRFIPLAEETGLILPIGEWILRSACAQVKAWHQAGHSDVTMAINVSARQFKLQNIPELVRSALAESQLDAQYLELELTESVLMQDRDKIVEDLRQIKAMGVKLSLDDFGTGYSSLSYLRQFPIDVIKIDQSFIRDVTDNPSGASLAKSIIAMAQSLSMTTIAEGVETEGQLGFLSANRCDAIQGYYFSRPLPSEEMADLLGSGTSLPADQRRTASSRRTLLIVDDEEAVLQSLKRMLRGEGYQILSTTSPQEALELLAVHPVGVIVSDQRMPLMSGTDLLRRVKNLHSDVVRIMLSGYTEFGSITNAINEGAVYKFLTKPWDNNALCETIAEAFRRHEINLEEKEALQVERAIGM